MQPRGEAQRAARQHAARQGRGRRDHPLHLGMLGMHGTAYANKAVIDCDLIMAIGARWDDRITGKLERVLSGRRCKIHVDIDPAEFDKIDPPRRAACSATRRLVIEDLSPTSTAATATSGSRSRRVAQAVPAQVQQAGRPAARSTCSTGSTALTKGEAHHHHRRRPAPDVGRAVLS